MQPNMITSSLLEPSLRLMCLHFHPMAVSRWFSAASLKQVSNMAITRSGSLVVSLSVFMISAAFLPKGKFFAVLCACVSVMLNDSFHNQSKRSTAEKLWCVCALRCAQASPLISASLFYRSHCRCRPWNIHDVTRGCSTVYQVISARMARVLSWVLIAYCKRLHLSALKSTAGAAPLGLGEEKVSSVVMEWNALTVFRRRSLKRVSVLKWDRFSGHERSQLTCTDVLPHCINPHGTNSSPNLWSLRFRCALERKKHALQFWSHR